MAKMNCGITVLFCCCVLINVINQAAYADKEDISEELMEEGYQRSSTEINSTSEDLSLESHEAMTKGGEFKPKFTIATTSSSTKREKRSYEFLLGLVNNNSKFQVTNTEDDTGIPRRDKVFSEDLGASELLLEMMVKIAAHPDQWAQVHKLLQKIDNDLMTSKKIVKVMETSLTENEGKWNDISINKSIEINKKIEDVRGSNQSTTKDYKNVSQYVKNGTSNPKIHQMTVNVQNEINRKTKNNPKEPLKTNHWSYGVISNKPPNPLMDNKEDASTTRYPWQIQTKPVKSSYPRNFAYHRVTGNPLYHTNVNNNPKAYIAVSVIAPKPINDRPTDDDLVLENELRELKPWTHNQNLKNMASIRSRWVIQSDEVKPSYAP